MIHNKHIFDTADYSKYSIAQQAAEKAGMTFYSDYRANCFKCYHFEIIAETFDQDVVLTNIILASYTAPGMDEYRKKLIEYIAS